MSTPQPSNTVRVFVAVAISPELERECAGLIRKLQDIPAQVKWVRPEGIHITLKFLGNVAQAQLPQIKQAIQRAVEGQRAFSITSNGIGGFPSLKRPRVIWIGLQENTLAPLKQLQQRVEAELARLGFEPENRPFKPHLTLGRVRTPRNIELVVNTLEKHPLQPISFPVEEVLLMRSELRRDGARYTPLERFALEK